MCTHRTVNNIFCSIYALHVLVIHIPYSAEWMHLLKLMCPLTCDFPWLYLSPYLKYLYEKLQISSKLDKGKSPFSSYLPSGFIQYSVCWQTCHSWFKDDLLQIFLFTFEWSFQKSLQATRNYSDFMVVASTIWLLSRMEKLPLQKYLETQNQCCRQISVPQKVR